MNTQKAVKRAVNMPLAGIIGLLLLAFVLKAMASCPNRMDAFDTSHGACSIFGWGMACTYQESANCTIGCQPASGMACVSMGSRSDCLMRVRSGTCSIVGNCVANDTPPPYSAPMTNPVTGTVECP